MEDHDEYFLVKDNFEKKLLTRWASRILLRQKIFFYGEESPSVYHLIKLVEILTKKSVFDITPSSPHSQNQKAFDSLCDLLRQKSPSAALPSFQTFSSDHGIFHSFLFRIFFFFEQFPPFFEENAKKSLLKWVQNSISSDLYSGITVNDFKTSWKSGLALCYLIHSFNPKCIKLDKLNAFDSDANIRLCIYASNVLFNFNNFFNYFDYVHLTEISTILLVSEYNNAFEMNGKINQSKEIISDITKLLKERSKVEKMSVVEKNKLTKRMDQLKRKIAPVKKKVERNLHSANKNVEETSLSPRLLEQLSLEIFDCREALFITEKLRFDHFLTTLKLNSKKLLKKLDEDFEKCDLIKRFKILKHDFGVIDNLNFYFNNDSNSMINADKKHSVLTTSLIEWTDKIRQKLNSPSLSNDIKSITNEINSLKALNLEINLKQNYYREEFDRLEKYMEEKNYGEIEEVKNRISLQLFDVISKEWLTKLKALRELYSKILIDHQIDQLHSFHHYFLELMEKREDEFYEEFCFEKEVENLIEAKRLVFLLKTEHKNKIKLNQIDKNKMEKIEQEIQKIVKDSHKYKTYDEKYLNENKKKVEEMEKLARKRYEEAESIYVDLVTRELFKERVLATVTCHTKLTEKILAWCNSQQSLLDQIDLSSCCTLFDAFDQLSKAKNVKEALEHEMNSRMSFLDGMATRVMSAHYLSKMYPRHCWRFDHDTEEDLSFRKRNESIFVAYAQLSAFCEEKIHSIHIRKEEIEENDERKIQFSAVVDEFKTSIEDYTVRLRSMFLSTKMSSEEVEKLQKKFNDQKTIFLNQSIALLNDAKKKLEKIQKFEGEKIVSNSIIEKMETMLSDFESLIHLTSKRVNDEINKFDQNENLCKKYSEEVQIVIKDSQNIYKENRSTDELLKDMSSEDLKESVEKMRLVIRELDQSLSHVTDFENELLQNEILFNPYSVCKVEDCEKWKRFVEEVLEEKIKMFERIEALKRLKKLTMFEIENIHKNYSKHFDSEQKAYIDKESFKNCMEDLEIKYTKNEIDEMFEKIGIKSKKNPKIKLIGFKKFADFIDRAGQEMTEERLIEHLSVLNNGQPFLSQEQLAAKLDKEDSEILTQQILAAGDVSAQRDNVKRFFVNKKPTQLLFRDLVRCLYDD